MPTKPLVSIVIPAYNAAPFLARAVESARRQTVDSLQIVVVDDGSRDRTADVAAECQAADARVTLLRKPNGGPSSARNVGIAAATGEYLCFLDADDVLLPDKLERQLAFLEFFTSCDLVYSDHYVADDALNPLWLECRSPPQLPMQDLLAFCNWFAPMSPLLRAGLAAKIGPFDEELIAAEDWDYWIRASQCGVLGYLPGPVAVYRTHPTQAHHHRERMRSNQHKVIRKHFAPGSKRWRLANAAHAWSDAKRARVGADYLGLAANLCKLAWNARTRRDLKAIATYAY